MDLAAASQPTRRGPALPAKVIIAAAVIVAAAAYLVITAIGSSAVYYLTVGELRSAGPTIYGQPVRVAGNVVPGSIQRDPSSLVVAFEAEDASGRIPVVYRGVLPDIFGDGIEVVLEPTAACLPRARFSPSVLRSSRPPDRSRPTRAGSECRAREIISAMAQSSVVSSPPSSPALLVASGIVRRFGSAVALRGVDVRIDRGERVALVGPNGAGKTTLIRVLATGLRPDAGTLVIGGVDALKHADEARRLIGVVGHQTFLYGDLSVRENLRFYGRLYGVTDLDHRIDAVTEQVGLTSRSGDQVRTLSRGMQQRCSIARATLHDPPLLLLDEPETGLDEAAQQTLGGLLRDWAENGGAVLFSSHRSEWIRSLTDRAIVLRSGVAVSTGAAPQALTEGQPLVAVQA
jgi:heme exporter protein A